MIAGESWPDTASVAKLEEVFGLLLWPNDTEREGALSQAARSLMPTTKSEALDRIDRAREALEKEWNQYLIEFPEEAIDAVDETGLPFKILGFEAEGFSSRKST